MALVDRVRVLEYRVLCRGGGVLVLGLLDQRVHGFG